MKALQAVWILFVGLLPALASAQGHGPYTNDRVLDLLSGKYPDAHPELRDQNYRMVGRGISNPKWGGIALVCVGASGGCEKLRHVFYAVTGEKVFFGRTLSVRTRSDGEPLAEDIKQEMEGAYRGFLIAIVGSPSLHRRIRSNVRQIHSQDGWNWASDGTRVRSRKFWDYFFMVNFYIESRPSAESTSISR